MSTFLESFQAAFLAVAQIGLVIVASAWLIRRNIIDRGSIKAISNAVIYLFLPCLIFSNITQKLHVDQMPNWWMFPITALCLCLTGWPIALLFSKFRKDGSPGLVPLSFLQNAGYLVLPLGKAILQEGFDEFALYCFLFILAHNLLLWTIGKHYFCRESTDRIQWKNLISPPLVANLTALTFALTGARDFVPGVVSNTVSFIGEGAIPLATFVLGASLGCLSFNLRPFFKDCLQVNAQKLFLMPLLMLVAMEFIPWLTSTPVLTLLFILQAAAAPATTLMLQAQSYGRNVERVSAILLSSYILCAATIPLWTAIALARHS